MFGASKKEIIRKCFYFYFCMTFVENAYLQSYCLNKYLFTNRDVKIGTKDAMKSFSGYLLVCLVTNTPYLDYLWSLCKYNPHENQF